MMLNDGSNIERQFLLAHGWVFRRFFLDTGENTRHVNNACWNYILYRGRAVNQSLSLKGGLKEFISTCQKKFDPLKLSLCCIIQRIILLAWTFISRRGGLVHWSRCFFMHRKLKIIYGLVENFRIIWK